MNNTRVFSGVEVDVYFKKAHLVFVISDSHTAGNAMASWEICKTSLPGQIHSSVTACSFACLAQLLSCVRASVENGTLLTMPTTRRIRFKDTYLRKNTVFQFWGTNWKIIYIHKRWQVLRGSSVPIMSLCLLNLAVPGSEGRSSYSRIIAAVWRLVLL